MRRTHLAQFKPNGRSSGPHPIEAPTISSSDEVGKIRRFDCRYYDGCLNIAVDANWTGFSCLECHVQDLLPREEMVAEGRRVGPKGAAEAQRLAGMIKRSPEDGDS